MENTNNENRSNILAIIGLTLGIVSIPLLCVWYIGIFTGLIGLVITLISKPNETNSKYSSLGTASMVVNLLVIAFGMTILVITWAGLKQGYEQESMSMIIQRIITIR